jgi:hypothetical protein
MMETSDKLPELWNGPPSYLKISSEKSEHRNTSKVAYGSEIGANRPGQVEERRWKVFFGFYVTVGHPLRAGALHVSEGTGHCSQRV